MDKRLPIEDRSYGIIPIRFLEGTPRGSKPSRENSEVFVIYQRTLRPDLPLYWNFPKGHAEEDDPSPLHTAIRELEEETGLKVEISDILEWGNGDGESGEDTPFKVYNVNPIRKVGKETKFWVGVVRGEADLRLQVGEVAEGRWCGWEEAMALVTFENTKEMLRKLMSCFR